MSTNSNEFPIPFHHSKWNIIKFETQKSRDRLTKAIMWESRGETRWAHRVAAHRVAATTTQTCGQHVSLSMCPLMVQLLIKHTHTHRHTRTRTYMHIHTNTGTETQNDGIFLYPKFQCILEALNKTQRFKKHKGIKRSLFSTLHLHSPSFEANKKEGGNACISHPFLSLCPPLSFSVFALRRLGLMTDWLLGPDWKPNGRYVTDNSIDSIILHALLSTYLPHRHSQLSLCLLPPSICVTGNTNTHIR